MKQWYEELFTDFAESYEKEPYTQGTEGEVKFILNEINHNKDKKILDIGCGTGRHSIELLKLGYDVTGIDLSESQLKKAREKADAAGIKSNFIKMDARNISFKSSFDLAIMICEGGFSLMETDEMNFSILKNAFKALNKEGKFIFTTLSAFYPLFHNVKDFYNNQQGDDAILDDIFNILTFRSSTIINVRDDNGVEKEIHCTERYYIPSEIDWLLKSIGFKKVDIFGCKLGAFSRNDKLTVDDFEMLVIAEK